MAKPANSPTLTMFSSPATFNFARRSRCSQHCSWR
jgi:hypothetical protein